MRRVRPPAHLVAPGALLVVVWIVFGSLDSRFLSSGNVYAILVAFAPYGLVAVGVGITILMGEGDLSVGSTAALGGVLAIRFSSLGVVLDAVVCMLILIAFGAAQGYLIGTLGINSLVFTVGSLLAVSGLAYLVAGNTSLSLPPDRLGTDGAVSNQVLGVLSPMAIVALVFAFAVWLVLSYTRLGRELYALGGGRREAVAAGVRVRSRLTLAFACSAGAAGLAGALSAMAAGGAAPTGTSSLLLTSIAAVLIGGVALSGGVGSVLGICLGALAIVSIDGGVAMQGAASNVGDLLTAALLVCVLVLEGVVRWSTRRRRRGGPPLRFLDDAPSRSVAAGPVH